MMRKTFLVWTCILLASGCHSSKYTDIRQEHAQNFPKELKERSQSVLAEFKKPLTLKDCVHLSMENGFALKNAEIQQRIAGLDRNISLANFLPAVSLDVKNIAWDPNPLIKFGGAGVAMHDKDVQEVTWNIKMAIFNPATWFLHGMYRRGYEIAGLANEYTRQAIAFQVTALFYQCLTMEQMEELLEKQLAAAEVQAGELAAWRDEGLLTDWQAEQGRVMVLSKTAEAHRMKRAVSQAFADLLAAMGLSPDTPLTLQTETPLQAPEGTLEDLMTEALLHHPKLAIADRKIDIEKEKVRIAIARFLPSLAGIASHIDTSDSHQIYSDYWMGGLSGTVSVFNGFADVNQYKAARKQQEAAFIQREQASLTLMVQVMRAYDQVQSAREILDVADAVKKVAESRLNETLDRHAQGLVQTGELLNLTAETDKARVQALQAIFQYQISIAALTQVLGRTDINFKDSKHANS
ncbi:MAG: TolC family protein [Proteobacteria bacterium]|nr:TolC family protein [Pseudomonadota bacterium]MBU4472161.1 TolC family protein [Pseudomonadota bacterium]MCG2753829.1 TolC family protein [Desulfobacteraceae bacterium]